MIPYTYEQWRWAYERFCEGYTIASLAEFLGVHRESVRRAFNRHGWRPLDKTELPPLEEIRHTFPQGDVFK